MRLSLFSVLIVAIIVPQSHAGKPELKVEIDGRSQLAETTAKIHVANGTRISISCTIVYDGFTSPAVTLVRRDSKGFENVLRSVAQSRNPLYIPGYSVVPGVTLTVSAEYTVKESDAAFDVVCSLVDSSLASKSTAAFQGPVTEPASTSLSAGAIVGIVMGVIALVSLIIIAALIFMHYRRRRMHNHCSYPSPSSRHAQPQPPPIHYSQYVKRPTVPPPPYPPYVGISTPSRIPGFTPSATPLLTFPTGNSYPAWNVSESEKQQPAVSNRDIHLVSMNQQMHINGEPLHEEMVISSNQPYFLRPSVDENALEHVNQPSQLQRE